MQNTSLIATLPTTISPNDYLIEELNENKAGSSDFQLNSVWRIATAARALLFRGHLHWCCSNEFGWQCFPGQPFRERGRGLGWVDNFHKPLSFTRSMKIIEVWEQKGLLRNCFCYMNYSNKLLLYCMTLASRKIDWIKKMPFLNKKKRLPFYFILFFVVKLNKKIDRKRQKY